MTIALFDYLNSINTTKVNLMVSDQDEKDYNPYLINRGLSLFADTCLYVNELNRYQNISKRHHYDFLINSITKKKRFSKWPKKEIQSDDLKMIADYFKCSYEKAKVNLSILTPLQIEGIRLITDTGGRH